MLIELSQPTALEIFRELFGGHVSQRFPDKIFSPGAINITSYNFFDYAFDGVVLQYRYSARFVKFCTHLNCMVFDCYDYDYYHEYRVIVDGEQVHESYEQDE